MFQKLLLEETIHLGAEAPDFQQALALLVSKIPETILPKQSQPEILKRLIDRELLGTTALGDSIALPCCVSPLFQSPIALLAISRKGVPFQSLDGQPVHFIFFLGLPVSENAGVLKKQILGSAEHFLKDRFFRERLKIAESAEEVLECILRESSFSLPAALNQ